MIGPWCSQCQSYKRNCKCGIPYERVICGLDPVKSVEDMKLWDNLAKKQPTSKLSELLPPSKTEDIVWDYQPVLNLDKINKGEEKITIVYNGIEYKVDVRSINLKHEAKEPIRIDIQFIENWENIHGRK